MERPKATRIGAACSRSERASGTSVNHLRLCQGGADQPFGNQNALLAFFSRAEGCACGAAGTPFRTMEAELTVETRDLRRSKRRRVLIRATIITVDGAQSARVRDLATTGAGIVSDRALDPGSDVIFKRGNLLVAARVVWASGNEAGLEFYRPLPLEELTQSFPADKQLFFPG